MLKRLRESGVDATYINVTASGGVLHLWGGTRSIAECRLFALRRKEFRCVRKVEDHNFVMPQRLQGAMGAQQLSISDVDGAAAAPP